MYQEDGMAKGSFLKIQIFIFILCIPGFLIAQGVKGNLSIIGDATHLEFQGLKDWDYQLKRISENKVELIIPPLDKKTEEKLLSWKSDHIQSVKIDKKSIVGKYKV
ncbi:MAG: hypothetical protein D6797_00545, partial [Bdellovibrio sp.]